MAVDQIKLVGQLLFQAALLHKAHAGADYGAKAKNEVATAIELNKTAEFKATLTPHARASLMHTHARPSPRASFAHRKVSMRSICCYRVSALLFSHTFMV
jgi:hypothetical protein